MCATTDLCDFHNIFCDVVFEWRRKENDEDHRCTKGNAEKVFPLIYLLIHAASMYTIEAFVLLEKQFIDSAGYKYKEVQSASCHKTLEVWDVRNGNEGHGE